MRYYQELLRLSKMHEIDDGDLDEVLKQITESLAQGLGVDRASIWFYNEDESAIVCKDLFVRKNFTHENGLSLFAKDFPSYFAYLKEERTLPVSDARSDPATNEFTEVYLRPLDIFSMLDAPIRLRGKMIGVLCNETEGRRREWTINDQTFAGSIADIISRALQAKERIEALKQLETFNQNLEQLVKVRTEELEEQRLMTITSSRLAALGEMAAGIAHEINNPLAIILGYSEEMRSLIEMGNIKPERFENRLEKISNTCERIEKIIRNLKIISRGDVSSEEKQKIPLQKLLEDTLILCREKFKQRGVEVRLAIPEDLVLECQNVALSQVIMNLLNNSYDAILDLDEHWIEVTADVNGDWVEMRLTDSGPGIPAELQEKIFRPFFTTKPVGKGTGLGLGIIKGIIDQHKGEFFLDTKSPNTSFVIRLPKAA